MQNAARFAVKDCVAEGIGPGTCQKLAEGNLCRDQRFGDGNAIDLQNTVTGCQDL